METKRTTQRIKETKSWFFEKINNTSNPKNKGRRLINKIRDEKHDNTRNLGDHYGIFSKTYIPINWKI
jgi:hypothetical protein